MAKKKFRYGFLLFTVLYALVILTAGYFALSYLWDFAAAYEMARPYHAIDAYMADLTPDYICDRSSDLIATVDHHIQSEDACKDVIRDAVSGGVTYAKKTTECTDDKMVYILRTGNQVIGRVELVPEGEAVMGFTPWAVSTDRFDFSYLLTGTVATTVPESLPVYVNGALLDARYITESGIAFSRLEAFYDDYTLPTIVSYAAGPCLGEISLSVTDPQGNPVTIDESTDLNTFLDNCTEDEVTALTDFAEEFVKRYVRFTNASGFDAETDYYYLLGTVLKDSPLAKRCKDALVAMVSAVSLRYSITSVQLNHCTNIGNDRYLCDITYVLDVRNRLENPVQVFNIQVIVVKDSSRLMAETLRNY